MSESAANEAQVEYWNAAAGETWARFQDLLDVQLEPLGRAAIDALAPRTGRRILDVGCGCGHSTLELAKRVGTIGHVLGMDISRPMLAVARARKADLPGYDFDFAERDAQTAGFRDPLFDAVFSRFGVMFFADPAAAFANLRRALKPSGRLTFVCWRPLAENDWMRLPLEAARHLLPASPPADPLAPGPFAFADPDRVRNLLQGAGFTDIEITPFDAMIGAGNVDDCLNLAFRVGPLGSALRENPELKEPVRAAVRDLLQQHEQNGRVLMNSAVWIVTAAQGGAGWRARG